MCPRRGPGTLLLTILVLGLLVTTDCASVAAAGADDHAGADAAPAPNAVRGRLARALANHLQLHKLGPTSEQIEEAAANTSNHTSTLPTNVSISDYDDHFNNDESYLNNAVVLTITIAIILFEMSRDNIMGLANLYVCDDEREDRYFDQFGKITAMNLGWDAALKFPHYNWPVIIQEEGVSPLPRDKGKPIKHPRLYPYNGKTKQYPGFLGLVILEAENVPEVTIQNVQKNDILVAINCQQIKEGAIESATNMSMMEWHETELNPMLERLLEAKRAIPLEFLHLDDDVNEEHNGTAYMYCPYYRIEEDGERIEWYVEIIPQANNENQTDYCKDKDGKRKVWPGGHQTAEAGLEAWFEEYDQDHRQEADIDVDAEPGERMDLGISKHEGFSWSIPFCIFALVVPLVASFFFTYESLRTRQSAYVGSTYSDNFVTMYMKAQDNTNPNISTGWLLFKIIAGIILVVVVVAIRAATDFILKLLVKNNLAWKKHFNRKGKNGFSYLNTAFKIALLVTALYTCPLLFMNAMYVNNTRGLLIKRFAAAMAWTNYFLAVAYFAQQAIILINFYLKMDIEVIMSDSTANLILGVTGVVSALESLLEDTRDGHGINDGCDLYELGNTFRILNRDYPNTFPPGSTQELYCAEADVTFADLYNMTSENQQGYDRLDDGNMCTFTCTVHGPEGMAMSSYPIWCKDNGLAGARWTLSAHRESLSKRLCPFTGKVESMKSIGNPSTASNTTAGSASSNGTTKTAYVISTARST